MDKFTLTFFFPLKKEKFPKEVQETFLLLGVWGYPPIFNIPQSMGDIQGVWMINWPTIVILPIRYTSHP